MTKQNSKKTYSKPVVLATTKKNGNFSDGCQTKSGMTCIQCRCS